MLKLYKITLIFFYILLAGIIFPENPLDIVTVDYPPYEYVEDNEIKGIAVEIVIEVFRRMDQPISLREIPWARALKDLEAGEIDGAIEVFHTEDRENYLDFSNEILLDEYISLFVLKNSTIEFSGDFNTLAEYTFGIRKGFSYGYKFDEAVRKGIIKNLVVQVYDSERLFNLLSTGRVDILIGDKYALPYQYSLTKERQSIKRLKPDVQANPTYIVFSKKRNLKHVRDKFDNIIKQMKADGSYDEILKHWDSMLYF